MFVGRLFRSRTIGNIADWSSLFQLAFSLLAGGAVLSWPASSIDVVAQHGWGAIFFVALGILCVVILVASFGLLAWRYFSPFTAQQKHELLDARSTHREKSDVDQSSKFEEFEVKTSETIRYMTQSLSDRKLSLEVLKSNISDINSGMSEINKRFAAEPEPFGLLSYFLNDPEADPPKDKFESINRKILDIKKQSSSRDDEIIALIKEVEESIKGVSDNVDTISNYTKAMFRAERTMENYRRRLNNIDDLAKDLIDPLSKHEFLSDWGK